MFSLKDKITLVTGAGSGIGAAIAKTFAEAGAFVFVTDRDESAGQGTVTKVQCLRVDGRPIYAAQFHIEMAGTPENSRTIMGNFLKLARDWGDHAARVR